MGGCSDEGSLFRLRHLADEGASSLSQSSVLCQLPLLIALYNGVNDSFFPLVEQLNFPPLLDQVLHLILSFRFFNYSFCKEVVVRLALVVRDYPMKIGNVKKSKLSGYLSLVLSS